ncbi:hypothetical protein NDA17_007397 [Ustilago hordei]|nr:hypothetical protein NDA17_007397 [Ustilago hordei]
MCCRSQRNGAKLWISRIPFAHISSPLSVFSLRTACGRIYLALFLLRCYSAFFGYGYIHPDEWMQSGEPYFGFTLPSIDARVPWEWWPNNALRSISALQIQYLGVGWVKVLIKELRAPTGYDLFLVQRLSSMLWTVYTDILVTFVFPPKTARYMLCLFGISTAATTFLVRPFSNSIEAHQLVLCFLQVVIFYRNRTWYRQGGLTGSHWGVLTGLIAADGFFSRFTFAIFALPLGAFFGLNHIRIAAEGYIRPALRSMAVAIASLLFFAYQHVHSETRFYTQGGENDGVQVATLWGTRWIIPPINALLYNLKTENVAQHGLHPRWLHAVVNLPMMIGVANIIVLFIHGLHFVRGVLSDSAKVSPISKTDVASSSKGDEDCAARDTTTKEEEDERRAVEESIKTATAKCKPATEASTEPEVSSSKAATMSASDPATAEAREEVVEYVDIEPVAVSLSFAIIIFSLLVLSISPHQEARFLLPLAFPSTVIFAYALQHPYFTLRPKFTGILLSLHVIQHVLQLVLFSFLHQAGLLPALFSIDRSISRLPTDGYPLFDRYEHHLLYRTFTVPFHLIPSKGRGMYPRVEDYDSSNSPAYVMRMASIACNHTTLYAPAWVVRDLNSQAIWQGRVELWSTSKFGWHVDMDHLPETWEAVKEVGWKEAFTIQKLEIRCKSYPDAEGVTREDDQVIKKQMKEDPQQQQPHEEEERLHIDL